MVYQNDMHLFIAIFLSFLTGLLILSGSKTAFALIIFLFLVLLSIIGFTKIGIKKTNNYVLYIIIATIPFPYIIQFRAQDALSVTTLTIYFFFLILIFYRLTLKKLFFEIKSETILPILLFFNLTISLLLNPYFLEQSIRYYVAYCSGILLYFMILAVIKKDSEVLLIIKIVLLVLVLQSVIAFFQLKTPAIANYFNLFARRETIAGASIREGFLRATGTVGDYELLAEWFLVGAVLSMCLIYKTKKYGFYASLLCSVAGIVFTNTRSALLLLVFMIIIIFIFLNLLKNNYKELSIKILLLIFGFGLVAFMFTSLTHGIFQRMETFLHSSDITSPEAINRAQVWKTALDLLKNPKIFGNGLYDITSQYISINAGGFHSLYLTILYKIGIFGLVIYAIFWLTILIKAWCNLYHVRESENWFTIFFLTISVTAILIDESKIEYLRYEHTTQFAWVMYALLVVSTKQSNKTNENIVVSKIAI
ncbi:MAG: O-antigen ligase family protein [Planctomycetes bacterium]|nr:O-antigen ligase family protein [Planctomycetota bacterium]